MGQWIMPLAVTAAMVVLDVVSGIAKGVATKTLSSGKMREGLWHKSGYLLVVACACLVEWGSGHMDLGFDVPLVVPVCVFVVLAEVMSVLENAAELNPDLKGSRLLALFDVKKGDGE